MIGRSQVCFFFFPSPSPFFFSFSFFGLVVDGDFVNSLSCFNVFIIRRLEIGRLLVFSDYRAVDPFFF